MVKKNKGKEEKIGDYTIERTCWICNKCRKQFYTEKGANNHNECRPAPLFLGTTTIAVIRNRDDTKIRQIIRDIDNYNKTT